VIRHDPYMTPEHHEEHATRVRIWVTFVIFTAFTGSMFLPEASGYLGFLSSLFWVWRN
jgi:hypothetical protein